MSDEALKSTSEISKSGEPPILKCCMPPLPSTIPDSVPTEPVTVKPVDLIDKKRPELKKHDASVLDLTFIMDCTGSMGSYIENATESIRNIVEEIVSLEKSDVKLALVEYRDHPPQEETFVTRVNDFTESAKTMKTWLEACSAVGGGDGPEAVADGLNEALKLSWRENSTKIAVLISDAPPHGIGDNGDGFPNGCPAGIDPLKVVAAMAEKAITLYAVGCEPALYPYKEFFAALAYKTGGQYVPLRNAKLLAKVIVGGAVEEISLEKLVEEAQSVVEEQRVKYGITDEKLLADAVQTRLKSSGCVTNQIRLNNQGVERASETAVKLSKLVNLEELRKEYKPTVSSPTLYGGGAEYGYGYGGSRSYLASPMRMSTSMKMHSATVKHSLEKEVINETASASGGIEINHVSSTAPLEDNYSIAREEISYAQSERLVQKALNRGKY